jgi:lysophospholipase L1-like esterase
MRIRAQLLKTSLLVFAALGVSVLIVLGVDRILPWLCRIPVYTPALSSMGPRNLISRYVSCDFDCTVHTNSLGLRGPEFSISKTGKFRIAVIGSSYTFGWGVNDDACFVRLLESGLRARGMDVEVLNLGRNGGSPWQYALLGEEVIPLFKPDLVIVAAGQGIDIGWSGPTPLSEWIPHTVWSIWPNLSSVIHAPSRSQGGGTTAMPVQVPTDEQIAALKKGTAQAARKFYEELPLKERQRFDGLDDRIKSVYFSGELNAGVVLLAMNSADLYTRTFDLDSSQGRERLYYLSKYLHAVARTGRKEGIPTVVLSVPFGPYVNERALANYKRLGFDSVDGMLSSGAPDDAIRRACGDLPFLNVTEAFRRQSSNPKLFFELDLHLSADGHALFAREILPWVEEQVRDAMKLQHR